MRVKLINIESHPWFVYVVECADSSLYTGITNDVARRINEHNYGAQAAKYTRARRPVELVYIEGFDTRSMATKREYEIKKMPRGEKLKLISENKAP